MRGSLDLVGVVAIDDSGLLVRATSAFAICGDKSNDIWNGGERRWAWREIFARAVHLRVAVSLDKYKARPCVVCPIECRVRNTRSNSKQPFLILKVRRPQYRERANIIRSGPRIGILNTKGFSWQGLVAEISSYSLRISKIIIVRHNDSIEKNRDSDIGGRRMPDVHVPYGDGGKMTYVRHTYNQWRHGSLPRAIVGLGNFPYAVCGVCRLMQRAICRREDTNRKKRLYHQNESKNRKPKIRLWKIFSDIVKATAPIWLFILCITVGVVGGILIIHGLYYVGILMVVLMWAGFGVGWGWARDLSRSILDGHD